MLMSALLIHLTGGRIETHFHVFGSLAFLAYYRDWRVLIPATLVVAADHATRGIFFPQSVFGVLTASPWRWVEHATWVLFEDVFLAMGTARSLHEMMCSARENAQLVITDRQLRMTSVQREQLLAELKALLAQQNVTVLGELGFENAYALVMPRKRAEALGIHSIADLAAHAATMSIAADYEFFARAEWARLRDAYGLEFRTQRQMQPDFMYAAVASGEVDVIAGYTSDGLIAKYDLVVLDDPRHAIPPYDAILLLAPKRGGDQALRAALQPLLGKIDITTMREANLRAAGGDGASSPDAVARWLWEKIGKR